MTKTEVLDWLKLDEDESIIPVLIQTAYDVAEGCINDFAEKVKSAKFKRKLKLLMLNYIVTAYDKRGLIDNTTDKMQFINATLLMQLNYGAYSEEDL